MMRSAFDRIWYFAGRRICQRVLPAAKRYGNKKTESNDSALRMNRISGSIRVLFLFTHIELGFGINDLAPIKIPSIQRSDKHLRGSDISCHWNVMKIAKSQEISIVRATGIGGIAEKQQHIYLIKRNS